MKHSVHFSHKNPGIMCPYKVQFHAIQVQRWKSQNKNVTWPKHFPQRSSFSPQHWNPWFTPRRGDEWTHNTPGYKPVKWPDFSLTKDHWVTKIAAFSRTSTNSSLFRSCPLLCFVSQAKLRFEVLLEISWDLTIHKQNNKVRLLRKAWVVVMKTSCGPFSMILGVRLKARFFNASLLLSHEPRSWKFGKTSVWCTLFPRSNQIIIWFYLHSNAACDIQNSCSHCTHRFSYQNHNTKIMFLSGCYWLWLYQSCNKSNRSQVNTVIHVGSKR